MASNNSRPNRFVPESGGGWRKTPQQQPRRSAKPSPKHSNNKGEVLRYLTELFGQVLEEDIIETIAESCGWNADSAIESLIELSNDVGVPTSNHSPSSLGSQANQAKVIDQPRKAPPYRAPKPMQTINPSPAMAAIKVAYQGYDDDSDDADIIMEEDEEFEVASHGNQSLPSLLDARSSSSQVSVTSLAQNCSLRDMKRGPKECPELLTIRDYITNGNKILILMRGCPGSGKSYLARTVVTMYVGTDCDPTPYIFSTDAYFYRSGKYIFNPGDLPNAHEWNQKNVTTRMQKAFSPIIVDNTNTMIWEMKSYAKLAVQYGYAVELLEPTTPWCWKESELARRNSHGVARPAIRNMLDRYEKVTADQLMTRLKLLYAADNYPPQPCSNPITLTKKTKNYPTKENGQNVIVPLVQLQAQSPSLLAFKLGKLDVTPLKGNEKEASSQKVMQETLPMPLVAEIDHTNNIRSQNLFADLTPLTQASLFTKIETTKQQNIKEEQVTPVETPDVTTGEPTPGVESLQNLVDAQDSIGWQLIESLDDVITIGELNSESPSTYEESTEPDLHENLRQDVDYAPKSSNELLEEMEETNASFVGEESDKTDEDMESLEKVLGDAFDHAFKLPFGSNEVAQQEVGDTPDIEINSQTGSDASNAPVSPFGQMCRDSQRNEDDSINTCLEYVVVGPDNSLVCQKSHDDFDKRTEDVTKQVIESVLGESVDNLDGDEPDKDNAQSNPVHLPGESVTIINENCNDTTNPFMGLLETSPSSSNKDVSFGFQEEIAIKDNQSFSDDLHKEVVSKNPVDQLGIADNLFQIPWTVSVASKSESNEAIQTKDTTKRVESSPPEKVSTKLDLFSWFFTKKKPLPDLTESQQISKDDGLLEPSNTENNLPNETTNLLNESRVEDAQPSSESTKWKLNSSWDHSTVEEDGTSQEFFSTVRTNIETNNSSSACEDVNCETLVQIINVPLKETEAASSESSELNSRDQIVPSSKLSELSCEHAASSFIEEPGKPECCMVSSADNVLDSVSTFHSDFSLLDAEIQNSVQSPPTTTLQEVQIASEPDLMSSSNANIAQEPLIVSETDVKNSPNANIAQEPLIDSEPDLTSSSNANIAQRPPIDSDPDLTSSANADVVQGPLIDSELNLTSSANPNVVKESLVDSEPNLTSSANADVVQGPLIDSEPDLTSSVNADVVQEPPIDSEPDLTSSANTNVVQEPLVDSEPDLTNSCNGNLHPLFVKDTPNGSDALIESDNAIEDITSHREENISSRLGSENYQYASAWSKMSPSNLLQDDEIPSASHLVPNIPSRIPTKDSETNTSYSDFSLIEQEDTGNVQYLSGHSRSINIGRNSEIHRTVPTISTLDKGSMTAPEDFDSEQPDFELLVNMFPKIARELLKELFEKCQGEINWTVDLLLESGHAFEPSESLEIRFHNTEDLQVTQQLLEELDIRDMKRSIELDSASLVTRGFETCETEEPDSVVQADEWCGEGASASKAPSPSKRGNKKQTSELSLRLKKEMEKNIDLNDSSYSEETLRLKKIRHGQPSNGARTEHSPEAASGHEATPGGSDVARQHEVNDQECEADDEEGSVPFTLDSEFLAQLQALFGQLDYPYPDGVAPVVDLPVTLARQVHSVLMESQQKQFDMQEKYFADMIKDEEFARRLQEEEMPAPDLRQIMDMELALELYKADATRLRDDSEDMATRLSRRKLTELFPAVDPEMLYDVFAAHGNSFQATLDVLEASTGEPEEAVRNVLLPEALLRYEKQLIEKAKQESFKQRDVEQNQANSAFERSVSTATSSKDQALEQAKLYREEANRQYQLRNRCYQQAHDAMRNGQTAVASYYAQVGQLYKQYIDKANARAAASLLTAHTMCKSSTTLDLHYLFVVEALQALDIFIDHHISKLVDSGKNSQQLFLITGGGNRSVGGRPKIKPAVQKRLIQRGIKYSSLNHGQLRIVITRHMALSNGNTVN